MFEASVMKSLQTMQDWSSEYRVNIPSKGIRWLHAKSKPEKLEDGSVLWNGIINDITNEKTLELKYSQQAKVIEQIHDGVITTDLQGDILSWNHGAEVLLEYKFDEMIGKHISMLYLKEDLDSLNKSIETLLQDEENNIVRRLVKKSKKTIYADISLSILKDEMGEPVGMM